MTKDARDYEVTTNSCASALAERWRRSPPSRSCSHSARWRHESQHETAVFQCVIALVTLISVYIVATVFCGVTQSNHRRLFRLGRVLGILNILVAFWFLSVEWYWFFEVCPNCRHSRVVTEYRLLSFVLNREEGRDSPTLIQWVAADLGIPCSHKNAFLWVKQHWTGLCLLVHDGGMRLSNDLTYPPCARETVRSWLAGSGLCADIPETRAREVRSLLLDRIVDENV